MFIIIVDTTRQSLTHVALKSCDSNFVNAVFFYQTQHRCLH